VSKGSAPDRLRPVSVASIRKAVLQWAEVAGRDLPWRRTRDPWAVLVSEVMLAQTQVTRVIPKWVEFLARWPDAGSCARAPRADVIAAWSGLGYNRRAVQLHRAAGLIITRHGGSVPADLSALTALPGVGPYTARAVLTFAYERPVGVVDTNAARVLARAVAGRPLLGAEVQAHADRLVPTDGAWAWNQAVLDLGATVCTARRPACGSCPLGPVAHRAPKCRWARSPGMEDPARGSAATSRPQSGFEGSNRQGRGRLLAAFAALAAEPVVRGGARRSAVEISPAGLATAAGWPDDPVRALEVARSLVEDGLVEVTPDGMLRLPPHSGIGHTDGRRQFDVDRLTTPSRG
jgi:A/G-specific adenine glycosylase